MQLLFWNAYQKPNNKMIKGLLSENDIDIAILAEYVPTAIKKIADDTHYRWCDGNGGCDKVTLLAKEGITIIIRREQDRYTIYDCSIGDKRYTIAGIHNYDRLSHPMGSARLMNNVRLVSDIEEAEKQHGTKNTIIIGDFNDNPFDESIIAKESLNATLFKSVALSGRSMIHNGKERKQFYNPILQLLRDEAGKRGSIYNAGGDATLFWNCFDQILFRKDLINSYVGMKYCTEVYGTSLMARVRPNTRYSDHLPLIASFL